MKMIYPILALFILGTGTGIGTAHADNKHGTKVKIVNETNKRVVLWTYNSDDRERVLPHKIYYLSGGEWGYVKAHGNGNGNIWLDAAAKKTTKICQRKSNGRLIDGMKVDDHETVVIEFC